MEGKAACGWGGERGEPGAWGEGGRNNIVARAHQVLAVSPNKKEESATLRRGGAGPGGGGGGRREPPPAPALQPLPVNPCSATLLKKGGASGGSPLSPGLFRGTTSPLVLWEMWLRLGSVVAGLSFPFLKA